MQYFIFRNTTIEPFFIEQEALFSQYDDISNIPSNTNIYIWFYILPFKSNNKILIEEITSYYNSLKYILSQIVSNKDLFIFTLQDYLNFNTTTGDFDLLKAIYDFNIKIVDLMKEFKNVKVINFADFIQRYKDNQLIDWKFYYLSKMQLNPQLAIDFKQWFNSQMHAIEYKRKKCIIIDLDNTLWGGILGEDGLYEIQIGSEYPGSAFLDFQKSIIELVNNGVILAICSKNNEADVLEVWEKNPNNQIKNEHISAYRINWQNKAENIKELIEELNIGSDSIVFIDDNPTERELVKQFHPLIKTPDFPTQPYMLPIFTKELIEKYFKIYIPTKEDQNKTQQYKTNAERAKFEKSFFDITEYLTSLEIQIQLHEANSYTISRIAQMTQKTTQFNLTTKRYNVAQINQFIQKGDLIYCIGVKDKFGDSGITGLILINLNKENNSAAIDTLLLSCRIIGKGIEEAFCYTVFNKLKKQGYNMLYASFIPTKKNKQVENYYEKSGFNLINTSIDGEKNYKLNLNTFEFNIKSYYKIIDKT